MAWVTRGGQDPARLLKKYKGRVFAVHAKDHAPIGTRDDEMNFAPAGEGILTWVKSSRGRKAGKSGLSLNTMPQKILIRLSPPPGNFC